MSSQKNLIVVIGVTGNQGGSIADTFLQKSNWSVRGITRNPGGSAAKALASRGVEIVKGDLDDKVSLTQAFLGATVIFSNTDFFVHLFACLAPNFDSRGLSPVEYAYQREIEQGSVVAAAASDPAVLSTLERFIMSSLSDAARLSKGKYHVPHNDTKVQIMEKMNKDYPVLASRASYLHLSSFVTNWKAFPAMAPQKQDDGSYFIQRPYPPHETCDFVVAQKDTGKFVAALVELPPRTSLEGTSERLTMDKWTKLWAEALGVSARYEQLTYREFFAAAPESLKDELHDAWQYAQEFGHTGGDPDIKIPQQLGIHIQTTSIEEYFREEDWSSIL